MPLPVVLAIACSEGPGADTTEQQAFLPRFGAWSVTRYEEVWDTCGSLDQDTGGGDGDSEIALSNNGDGTFQIIDEDAFGGDGPLSVTCSTEELDFGCGPWTFYSYEAYEDTFVTLTGALTGTFADEAAFSGLHSLKLNCSGSGCQDLMDALGGVLPCLKTLEIDAQAQ